MNLYFSSVSIPVLCVDRCEPPQFIPDETVHHNVIAKAGQPVRLQLFFLGRPAPTVTWSKADEKVIYF